MDVVRNRDPRVEIEFGPELPDALCAGHYGNDCEISLNCAGSVLILILIFGIIGGSKVTLAIVDSKERHF
jgi:hypothetical protein